MIGFSGVHNLGKTTRAMLIAEELEKEYIKEYTRELFVKEFGIFNGVSTAMFNKTPKKIFEVQYKLYKHFLDFQDKSGDSVVDRTLIDVAAYSVYYATEFAKEGPFYNGLLKIRDWCLQGFKPEVYEKIYFIDYDVFTYSDKFQYDVQSHMRAYYDCLKPDNLITIRTRKISEILKTLE